MAMTPDKTNRSALKILSSSLQLLLLCFFSVTLASTIISGQTNVINQLEQNADPSRDSQGQVVRHINPTDVIHWTLAGHGYDQTTGKLNVTLALATERQFTIYVDKLKFAPSEGWQVDSMTTPKSSRQYDPISRKDVDVYTDGAFELVLKKTGSPSSAEVELTYVGCTTVICLFPHSERLTIPWTAPVNGPLPGSEKQILEDNSATASEAETAAPDKNAGTVEEKFAEQVKAGQMSFLTLLLIAFVGGLLTNLTPCVAPMIPITIRLLANQTVQPFASAALYAGGIVTTYTSLGVIAALSGALFGNLIAHPAVSITFGAVMFLLGINMLGYGDLSKLQQIGGRIGSSKGGLLNSFLMGAGAGLVASPCTGPILAALLTYTAGRGDTAEAIGLLGIYSVGFALPYVFLGASAAKISKVRVSFQVQIITKLIFASVMFALSLYFLRIPLYGLFTQLKPLYSMIGWVGVTIGVVLSAVIIVNESLHHKKALFLAPTLALGLGVFFGIQALTRSVESVSGSIVWLHNEQEAFAAANKSNKPILVDAWAEWCEACKKMDVTTFVDPSVVKEISDNWIALKFDLTEATDVNTEIQERYELPGLPTLTLLPPNANLKSKIAVSGYSSAEKLLETLQTQRHSLIKAAGP
jgi:thiol:disulfide interchange protein DsbD